MAGSPKLHRMRSTPPIAPLRTSSQATRNSFMERCMEPVCNTRRLASTAFITSRASWMLWVRGFSQ
jgi:hypothetical protein